MTFSIDDEPDFRVAAARESAHAAVAEHFGFEVFEVEVDWRGFPVCRYRGELGPRTDAQRANVVILLAGLVGERLARGVPWWTPAGELGPWLESGRELDPGDSPDAAFQGDLLLALRALEDDVAALQRLEATAHALLTGEVGPAWEALRRRVEREWRRDG